MGWPPPIKGAPAEAAGDDEAAEAYSNAMRNWDDRASTYFEIADLTTC